LSRGVPERERSNSRYRTFLYAKLHRVTVTDANLNYPGSITIDQSLLNVSGILPYSQVDVVNITQGHRLQTYVISGVMDSGTICLNGAAAHYFSPGDLAIVMAYELIPMNSTCEHEVRIIQVTEKNRVLRIESETLNKNGTPANFGDIAR
jgi:aspartate 1-decarboxylase